MNVHKNAQLTPKGRERLVNLVKSGLTLKAASRAVGVSPRTAGKWVRRFAEEGPTGLLDRSSRPKRLRKPTPEYTRKRIIELRHQRLTGKHIARITGVSPATVSRLLKQAGLSRLKDLEPKEPERRYVHDNPGDMIHLDIKKFGRFERPGHRVTGSRTGQSNPRARPQGGYGWEYLHVCIDDASRIAFTDIYPDEKKESAVAFLEAAVKYYARFGVTVKRVMTDNGACYKSYAFAEACKDWASNTFAPSPIRRVQMARPNASSRSLSTNGPMPEPIRLRSTEKLTCPYGPTCTIGTGHMAG